MLLIYIYKRSKKQCGGGVLTLCPGFDVAPVQALVSFKNYIFIN